MEELRQLEDQLKELNQQLIPLLNSKWEKKFEKVTQLKKQRDELNTKISILRKNLKIKYFVSFDYIIKYNDDVEEKDIAKFIHISDINVNYDSRIEGLSPLDLQKKKLLGEIFKKLESHDLSNTEYFIVYKIK